MKVIARDDGEEDEMGKDADENSMQNEQTMDFELGQISLILLFRQLEDLTSKMRRPESRNAEQLEVDAQMSLLSSAEKVVFSRAIMGHDLTECVSAIAGAGIVNATRKTLSVNIMAM